MGELIVRSAKLFPANRAVGAPSFATAFIYEPDDDKAQLGELFAVVEILTTAKGPQKVADLIVESFGKAFYDTNSSEADDSETAARFDMAVKAVNQALGYYTGHEDATWIGKTSAILAVAAGSELHITSTGSAEAYLLRQNRLAKIDAGDHEHRHQTHKPFTNIASGHIEAGDRILLATPALLRILSRHEITEILGSSSANSGATKIAQRIESELGAERVAAVIAETTTPEVAASQPLPDQPSAIVHGPSSSRFASFKAKAVPFLKTAHAKAKPAAAKAAEIGKRGWHVAKTKAAPAARRHGLRLTSWLRSKLRDPRQARWVYLGFGIVFLVAVYFIFGAIHSGSQAKFFKLYDQALTEARDGQQQWLTGNQTQAQTKLQAAQNDLAKLDALHPGKSFDKALQHRKHDQSDPASVAQLEAQVQNLLDQLSGLTRLQSNDLADLSTLGQTPAFLELVGTKLVAVGDGTAPAIATVDTKTGGATVARVETSAVGKVVAAAASDKGVYLLTDEPAVWFFNPTNNTVVKQKGAWVKGKAIASYSGNLYVLKDDDSQILRYLQAGSAFAAPTSYVTSGASNLAGADSLTVDGSVITAGKAKLSRFLTGSLAGSAKGLPSSFTNLKQVLSLANGDLLMFLDASSNRIGTATLTDGSLNFAKQYALSSGQAISAIATSDGVNIFALSGNKLVSFSVSP